MSKKAQKRKATELELAGASGGHTVFHNPGVKRVHFTVTNESGSSTSINTIGRTTPAFPIAPTPSPPTERGDELDTDAAAPELEARKRTQASLPQNTLPLSFQPLTNGQLLDDFEESFDELGMLLFECEADPDVNYLCDCGSGEMRTTKCLKCTDYAAACPKCFVKSHLCNPFHWAEVWDPSVGCFVRHDISKLDSHVIQLGHNGKPCKNSVGECLFTVVDGNGVHSTRLAFCGCHELPPNKKRQLMRAGLFPATAKDPHTAFTVEMLKEFSLHNLESKKAAYDYLGAIRRLTDNSFTADVANPYAAFLRVVRVFNYLTLLKRSGQLHGIDLLLPHRPPGNLLVWCPGCPEPGFNSDPNCPETPAHLRHLNQSQRTLDGNHQCNQFSKNTDPDDVSLCAGRAYFPLDSEYQKYLAEVPNSTEMIPSIQKATCNYLKVVNKQDKKKFKNMALTGTVNCQCSHVFILTCVDLPHSERFVSSSFTPFHFLYVDEAATYDIACQYIIYLEERFAKQFPDQLESVKKIRWGVPALHVQGHQDSCSYLFGTAYMECVGHFHGETAEHYWPEANQLGPHVRQMNLGHRQDTMINHHGDWNYKKTASLVSDLADEILESREKYVKKRDHFIALSASFADRVPEWEAMPRVTRKQGKEAISVYKHTSTKVPSQALIYERMITEDNNFAATLVPRNQIAGFLDRGFRIQDAQRTLKHLLHDTAEHELHAPPNCKIKLRKFRQDQKRFMPNVGDKIANQTRSLPALEAELLHLPSDLTEPERQKFNLVDLGVEESRWREGQVFDILRALQNIVKGLGALRFHKHKNDRQQKQNSRAGDQIAEVLKRQNHHIESYNAARTALISLNGSTTFPVLNDADLYMKPVQFKRRVGDSRRTDGLLWRANALATAGSHDNKKVEGPSSELSSSDSDDGPGPSVFGTQDSRRQSGPKIRKNVPQLRERTEKAEGWIWQLGKLTKMSNSEMDAWSSEGDRVQWFRAEAEMQRWQEQWEQKIVELLRTIRSFTRMQDVWTELAQMQPKECLGARAYARQKAAMFNRRKEEGREKVRKLGFGSLLAAGASVLQFVEAERKKERALVKQEENK
ncbi:hypothetical protein C8R46DRAFT_1170407 [Mycena filopes]|nr:hypothetical protein C8R46DRAFT_1170407 [Mycena filopes]